MKSYIYILKVCSILLGMALLVAFTPAAAQQKATKKITGKVTDGAGAPLAGVNVLVKESFAGTTTNQTGVYTLQVPEKSSGVLVFSFIGYNTQEVECGSRSVVDVTLDETVEDIGEVVVVGYGSMRKSDITGSVTSVKIDEVESGLVPSFDRLLQGRAAGVNVTTGSAAPGGAVSIEIRGSSSINSSSEPLYVVDGIIINGSSADTPSAFSKGGAAWTSQEAQNPLAMLNPRDIANIEILKDASATAIYGSQGANGVVLITTKQGTSEKPIINFSQTVETAWLPTKLPVLDFDEFVNYRRDINNETIENVTPMDWQDYSMRTAISSSTRVSVSGRTARDNYYVALGYMNNQGIIRTTGVSQTDVRFNYSTSIGKWVKLGSNSMFSYRNNSMSQGTDMGSGDSGRFTSIIRQMVNTRPYLVTDTEGDYSEEEGIGMDRWFKDYVDKSTEYRVVPSLWLEVNFLPTLKWRTTVGADYLNKDRVKFEGPLMMRQSSTFKNRVGMAEISSFRYNMDHQLTYTPKLRGSHSFMAMVGMSLSSTLAKNTQMEGQNMDPDEYREESFNDAMTTWFPGYGESKSNLLSFFTRLQYNYGERYIFTATFRADGSSKFAKGNKFGYFPSVAFAWRVSEERFMKGISDYVTNLKLRVGWGQVGNQSLAPYQTLSNYGSVKVPTFDPVLGPGYSVGSALNTLANPDLKWETSEQVNAGIDLGLFNNRISITADVYVKDTKDLLLRVNKPLSMSVGCDGSVNMMWVNQGSVRNKGLELAFNARPVKTRKFTWDISGNISFNRNKITSLNISKAQQGIYDAQCFTGSNITASTYLVAPANIFMVGQPMGMFFGLKTDGIIRSAEEIRYTYKNTPMEVGMRQYVNSNDKDNDINDDDRVMLGNPNPKFTGGFSTSFAYKGFSLDLAFTGVYGNKLVNANNLVNYNTTTQAKSSKNNIFREAYYGAWDAERNPGGKFPALGVGTQNVLADLMDWVIEDGSYLRLSNVTLSYRFNPKAKWLRNVTVSVTGRNLWLLTSYSGYDPDVNSFANDGLRRGVDYGSYPTSQAVIFSVGASF